MTVTHFHFRSGSEGATGATDTAGKDSNDGETGAPSTPGAQGTDGKTSAPSRRIRMAESSRTGDFGYTNTYTAGASRAGELYHVGAMVPNEQLVIDTMEDLEATVRCAIAYACMSK